MRESFLFRCLFLLILSMMLLYLVLLPASAVKPSATPQAAFIMNTTSGIAPLTIQFTDQSIGENLTYAWNFGDGGTSSDPSPMHTYSSSGTFTARLTVTNAGGTNSTEQQVEVLPPPTTVPTTASPTTTAIPTTSSPTTTTIPVNPPVAGFSSDVTQGNAPLTVHFTDTSSGLDLAYYWDFGDGNISTARDPVYTYVTAGVFDVRHRVTNSDGSDWENRTGFIQVKGTTILANFMANRTSGPAPFAVRFNDTSEGEILSYFWDFGDETISLLKNPVHTYDLPGTYSVSHQVAAANGTDWENRTDYISVLGTEEVADFTMDKTYGFAPLTVHFTDTSAASQISSWNWDFGDGTTSKEQNPTHTYQEADYYTIHLTIQTKNESLSVLKWNAVTVLMNWANLPRVEERTFLPWTPVPYSPPVVNETLVIPEVPAGSPLTTESEAGSSSPTYPEETQYQRRPITIPSRVPIPQTTVQVQEIPVENAMVSIFSGFIQFVLSNTLVIAGIVIIVLVAIGWEIKKRRERPPWWYMKD